MQSAPRRLSPPHLLQAVRGLNGSSLSTEIVAGITLAALMIPLNIGYAQVAGLPAIVGLYAAIVPMVAFALFANTRHLVASPDAAVAAMIVARVGVLAPPGDPRYVQLVFAQALLCGLIFFAFWAFQARLSGEISLSCCAGWFHQRPRHRGAGQSDQKDFGHFS